MCVGKSIVQRIIVVNNNGVLGVVCFGAGYWDLQCMQMQREREMCRIIISIKGWLHARARWIFVCLLIAHEPHVVRFIHGLLVSLASENKKMKIRESRELGTDNEICVDLISHMGFFRVDQYHIKNVLFIKKKTLVRIKSI